MNRADFYPVLPICPACGAECGISIELLEVIERKAIDYDYDELNDLDKMVEEAIKGDHQHSAHLQPPKIQFPMALDIANQGISILCWCFVCKKAMVCLLSVQDLIQMLKDADEDSRRE
jgi:hypothetical protein